MQNNAQKKEIYNVKGMAEGARYTEYKYIESAVAEIVDNSIEAQASEISIIISEKKSLTTGRKEISDIAFLDDGKGMNIPDLHGCLAFGEGTRKDRKGMGRFGVGLAQASLFACPRVEVYSWQAPNESYYTFLDTDMMRSGEQEYIEYPVKKMVPDRYVGLVKRSNHGTLVIWQNVDKSPVKTAQTLIRRLDEELGQIYRYFLNDEVVKIFLMTKDNVANYTSIKPRDPLFLMSNDKHLADPHNPGNLTDNRKKGETIFEPFVPKGYESHIVEKEIKYRNNQNYELTASVKIVFSIVKDKYYTRLNERFNNPGDSPIGKIVKQFTGISIVRARREVDFGKFGFFESTNNPNHRWWGCEIQFEPLLDEKFKISNNKQHVELKKPNDSVTRELGVDGDTPLWLVLESVVSTVINTELVKVNKARRKGTRPSIDPIPPTAPTVSTSEKDDYPDTKPTPADTSNPIDIFLKESTSVDSADEQQNNEKHHNRLISIIEQASQKYPRYLKIVEDPNTDWWISIRYESPNLLVQVNKSALMSGDKLSQIKSEDLAIIILKSICESFYSESVAPESFTYVDAITEHINSHIKNYKKTGDYDEY